MDYSDDWRAKFWIPCLNTLIGNDDALSECQKILIPTYDVFASWSNQNSVIKEATKISKYAVLAAESVWNRAKENRGLTTKDYAQVSYMCALITTIVGNQLESRFIKDIPLMKTSMLYAWSRGLLIFEDVIKNSEDPDRVQRIKLYESTKSKYEYYHRDLPNKNVIKKINRSREDIPKGDVLFT